MLPHVLLALIAPLLALAGDDGGITGATSSSSAAGYSCDATKCKLPTCNCASTSPPGGLSPVSVPCFLSCSFLFYGPGWFTGASMLSWMPRFIFFRVQEWVQLYRNRPRVQELWLDIVVQLLSGAPTQSGGRWISLAAGIIRRADRTSGRHNTPGRAGHPCPLTPRRAVMLFHVRPSGGGISIRLFPASIALARCHCWG